MLISISGSQGCGKSTIISKLNNKPFTDCNGEIHTSFIVERKTSRSILSDWGVSLQEVNTNSQLTIKFQDEIITRKFLDEQDAVRSNNLYYTERSYADLFVYAMVALGKDNMYAEWLNDYYKRCMEYQQTYQHIYYLKAGYFNVVGDGVRGESKHYSRMVDIVMLDYTEQMTMGQKIDVIRTPDINERVAIISTQSQFEWFKNTKGE